MQKQGTPKIRTRKAFSRALWDKWLSEMNGEHPHASALRAGILETRDRLAGRKRFNELPPVQIRRTPC